MQAKDYLGIIAHEIHRTIVATVDDEGLPVQDCILQNTVPFAIEQEHCLHCGNGMTVCTIGVVERR